MAFLSSVGCSTLGFPTTPIAHVMTDDTKQVLENSPRKDAVARELSKSVYQVHFLQPGDELLIESVDAESEVLLPADQRVLADGTVDLGKYGRVVVASLTLEQAEGLIQATVGQIENKSVSVNVRLVQNVHRYYVIGEVNSPGAFQMVGHETVLDAIMEAGGLTSRASACDILLARPTQPCSCRVALPVCYRAITQLGDTSTNYHVKPGDRIFVGRQTFCEELRSFCGSASSCERCCARQVACRSPQASENTGPEFLAPSTNVIPAPIPPSVSTLPDPTESSQLQNAPLPVAADSQVPQSLGRPGIAAPTNGVSAQTNGALMNAEAESSDSIQDDSTNRDLDGELDFESFLQKNKSEIPRQ